MDLHNSPCADRLPSPRTAAAQRRRQQGNWASARPLTASIALDHHSLPLSVVHWLVDALQATMAACSSRALPCSGVLSLHQHPHHLNVSQRASAALLTKPSRRLGAALRLAASASSTAATSSAGSSTSSFVQLYAGLAGVLAPGGAVAARPTPLGRGLVAEQPAAKGDTLLSGKL